eukprot:gene4149-2991_t
MIWSKQRFEQQLPVSECRLFPTQQLLFAFIDAEPPGHATIRGAQRWLPFSIEFDSEEETSRKLSHCTEDPGPAIGSKRQRPAVRQAFTLLYGTGVLSRQTRHFLACTPRGLKAIIEQLGPSGGLHLYEIIREGSPCHLYLDVECEGHVDVSQAYTSIDDDDDSGQEAGGRLLVVPAEQGCSQRVFTVKAYDQLLPPKATPPSCCPLSCPCVSPRTDQTTETLLRELHRFAKERYPHLLHDATTAGSTLPAHYQCWREVLILRSMAGPETTKYSQHYVIKMYGKVWDNNISAGVFVKEFATFLSDQVAPPLSGRNAIQLHDALFFHSGVRMWSVLANPRHRGGSALPFLVRKSVIDTAVYSRNRMMRCLGSSKLHRQAVLQVETYVREGRLVEVQLSAAAVSDRVSDNPETDVASLRQLGMLLNSLITVYPEADGSPLAERIRLMPLESQRPAVPTLPRAEKTVDVVHSPSRTPGAIEELPVAALQHIEERYETLCGKPCVLSRTPRRVGNHLVYGIQGTRYCQHVRREHKSNGIYIVVDTARRTWSCLSSSYRGRKSPVGLDSSSFVEYFFIGSTTNTPAHFATIFLFLFFYVPCFEFVSPFLLQPRYHSCTAGASPGGFSRGVADPGLYDLHYYNMDGAPAKLSTILDPSSGHWRMRRYSTNIALLKGNRAAIVSIRLGPGSGEELCAGTPALRVQRLRQLLHVAALPPALLDSNDAPSALNLSLGFLCADCIIQAVEDFNIARGCAGPHGRTACINSVFYRAEGGGRCLLTNVEALREFVLKPYSFVVHPVASSATASWDALVFAAAYNTDTWREIGVAPLFVVEWYAERPFVLVLPTKSPTTFDDGALAVSTPFSTLLGCGYPTGGWTIWGRIAAQLQRPMDQRGAKSELPMRHVVLLVPSTAMTAVGGGAVALPGADGAVSGIVAALAIAGACRTGKRNWWNESTDDVQLDVVLLPGEGLNGIGSASLFQQVQRAERGTAPPSNETWPLPPEIGTARVVIAMEQLGMRGAAAPLFFHVDERVKTSTNDLLRHYVEFLHAMPGVQPGTTKRLPQSPISRYLQYFPESVENSALLTFTRYDQVLLNPHVYSPSDLPSEAVGPEPVASAADVVLRLISGNVSAAVDRPLVRQLWECLTENLNCTLVGGGKEAVLPDFATKAFQPDLSPTERTLLHLMRHVGLDAHQVPALPPALSPVTPTAECWEWSGASAGNASTIFGEVVFAPSAGARIAMVDTRHSFGWMMLIAATFVCLIYGGFWIPSSHHSFSIHVSTKPILNIYDVVVNGCARSFMVANIPDPCTCIIHNGLVDTHTHHFSSLFLLLFRCYSQTSTPLDRFNMAANPKTVTLQAKDGSSIEVALTTTPEYEFKPGEVVHFSKSLRNGKVALIRGINDGLLWFSVFPTADEALKQEALSAPVETASCRVKAEFIRQYGWVVDEKGGSSLISNPIASRRPKEKEKKKIIFLFCCGTSHRHFYFIIMFSILWFQSFSLDAFM